MFERYNFDMKLGNVRDVLKASAVLRAVVDPSFLNLIADVTVEALPKKRTDDRSRSRPQNDKEISR